MDRILGFRLFKFYLLPAFHLVIISASKSALQAMHINVQRSVKHLGAPNDVDCIHDQGQICIILSDKKIIYPSEMSLAASRASVMHYDRLALHCNRVSLPSVDVLTTIVSKNIKSAVCKRMMLQNRQFHN